MNSIPVIACYIYVIKSFDMYVIRLMYGGYDI
jgi:hypothetical protein